MAFANAKIQRKNETTEISIFPYRPVPFVRHGQGKRPVDGNRPVEHRPEYRKQLQITCSGVNNGDEHGEEFSGNRENLRAGGATRIVA